MQNHSPATSWQSESDALTKVIARHGWWLIAAFPLVLPFGNAFELPLALMALAGLALLLRGGRELMRSPTIRWLFLLFACIWLPMLFSLPDAVNFKRSASTALVFLRFPLAALFAIQALRSDQARNRLMMAFAAILTLWVADGVLQAIAGRNLLGNPPIGDRLSGLFHPKLTLGHVLAVFAPIYFESIRRLAVRHGWWLWLVIVPYSAVILLSGSRTAWVMYAVGMAGFGVYLYLMNQALRPGRAALIILLCTVPVVALISQYAPLKNKVTLTAGLLSGDYDKANQATSIRLPIWQTALRMGSDHWINGVGPRGFRYVYPQYAAPGDYFMAIDPNRGPTHAHQIMLEILTETGAIGMLGFLAFLGLLARQVWREIARRQLATIPFALAVGAAVLPLNAGLAFYGSYWSSITWWLVAFYCAMLAADQPTTPAATQ